MAYGAAYQLEFCDALGNEKLLILYKNGYSGGVSNVVGGSSPIVITYKNENDDKFNPITTSSATISLIASESVNLNTFYTEDESEWLVSLLNVTESGVTDNWTGFLIPDFSNEPFLSYPYEFSLKASDRLGTLKGIPYTDGPTLIKKTASIATVISECLAKTGLELPLVTGVNTYFDTVDAGNQVDPLTKVFIDTRRFIDTNNQAFSCFEILKHLALQFTANLKQSGGKWTFFDISEYKHDTFLTWDSGNLIPFDSIVEIQPEQIANKDHSIEKVPAYGTVNSYYQYGFLSNKLTNGDFDSYDEVNNVFTGWTQVGASTNSVVSAKKEFITLPPPVGQFFTGNYSLEYKNAKETLIPGTANGRELDMNKYIYSDPVAVTFTSLIKFSVEVKGLSTPTNRIPVMLKLSAVGETDRYWNIDTKQWQEAPTIVINLIPVSGVDQQVTVSVDAQYPPHDGLLEIRLYGLSNEIPGGLYNAVTGTFDNATLNVSENKYYQSGIGYVSTATNNSGSFSKSPDPITLLFGDDDNKNRTSWMRDGSGNPTEEWFKVESDGTVLAPSRKLQAHVSTTVLYQHHTPTRRFEGSFRGQFKPVDSFSIPLTDGKFIFLSGDFDIKAATSRLVLAEILTNVFEFYDERGFEDKGSFKDENGNTVGSPTGVNIPPTTGGGGVPINQIAAMIDEVLDGTDDFIRNQTTLQTDAEFHVKGGTFNNRMTIPLAAPTNPSAGSLWLGTGNSSSAPVGGPQFINDLVDVTITGIQTGHTLVWDGTAFVNQAQSGGVSSLSALTDVQLGTLSNGQGLVYNSTLGKWENQNITVDLSAYSTTSQGDGRWLGINATAANSLKWAGFGYDGSTYVSSPDYGFLRNGATGAMQPARNVEFQQFLGLGTAAYTNSSDYLSTNGTAANSLKWAGALLEEVFAEVNPGWLLGYDPPSAKYKAISNAMMKSWLGLGSNAYNSTAYLPLTGGNVSGDLNLNRASVTGSAPLRFVTNGVNDWFIGSSPLGTSTSDLSLYSYGTNSEVWKIERATGNNFWTGSGTFGGALTAPSATFSGTITGTLSGNASSASILQTTRTLWGQSFNGSGNISGTLTGVTDLTASGAVQAHTLKATNKMVLPTVAPAVPEAGAIWIS